MINKALGMVEYQTVSAGIAATDLMIKTANVEVIQSSVVCPGKYITLLTGELSAVTAAIDSNIAAGNIKSGVTILGVEGTYTGD